ncbi:DUF3558 domain-containing protein [Nocardia cyriacigeorgica]|jgi:hypothetical protein|uniref:DUF3558 domain-containing protein n=1 Tax=Nocardia cyriacigeorgica TaxID=135487 RepID=UPI0009DA7E61|nr:DUF3558 domain-containing protein [Nocardia cyriacigeorgica]
MTRRARRALFTALASGLVVTGCGEAGDEQGTDSASATAAVTIRPQIAVSVPPPEVRPNNNRPPVDFDPCTQIGDDTITEIGFDPNTRERSDWVADTYTYYGCRFKQLESGKVTWRLRISGTNIEFTEYQDKYRDTRSDITVSDRRAMTYNLPGGTSDTCFLAMDSAVGVIGLQLSYSIGYTSGDPCRRVAEIARVVQDSLPTG